MMDRTVIGFIGFGLIGGSIAKAVRRFHPDYKICVYTHTPRRLEAAVADGVVDEVFDAVDGRFGACGYIFLCAPVKTNISYLERLKPFLRPGCILTDVGSVKGEIHRAAAALGMEEQFIGGHPMAGSEKTGYENAVDYLLENAYYIITPTEKTPPEHTAAYAALARSLGALPMVLDYEEHDYITACVSHLPHLIASALVNQTADLDGPEEHMRTIAAGGFKDITRIASSSPEMWQHICLSNRETLLKVLDGYIGALSGVRRMLSEADGGEIFRMFARARDYRDALPDRVSGPNRRVYVLYCDIYDEAGGIATVTTLLAMNGISIQNIGIVHNREFEEGVLRIEFYTGEALEKAASVLSGRNYRIHRRE